MAYDKYRVEDIWWDTDTDEEFDELPQVCEVDVDDDIAIDDVEDYISDWLSNTYGYCHHGFNFEKI